MPKIDLDDDIVRYLRSQVSDFEETPSTVLRRLLRLPPPDQPVGQPQPPAPPVVRPPAGPEAGGARVVITPFELAQADTAIERMMLVLSKLYLVYQERFDRVTEVRGAIRLYFSRNRHELEQAGTSVAPRHLPGTPYFMVTNLSDDRKREILERALLRLDVPPTRRAQLLELLDTGRVPQHEIDLGLAGSPPSTGGDTGLQI